MVFLDTMEELTHQNDMSGHTWAVFFFLLSRAQFGNHVKVSQDEIGRHVGMTRINAGLAIKRLLEKGLIERGPNDGTCRTYKISWKYAWRGSPESYFEEEKRSVERQLSMAK